MAVVAGGKIYSFCLLDLIVTVVEVFLDVCLVLTICSFEESHLFVNISESSNEYHILVFSYNSNTQLQSTLGIIFM